MKTPSDVHCPSFLATWDVSLSTPTIDDTFPGIDFPELLADAEEHLRDLVRRGCEPAEALDDAATDCGLAMLHVTDLNTSDIIACWAAYALRLRTTDLWEAV